MQLQCAVSCRRASVCCPPKGYETPLPSGGGGGGDGVPGHV